MIDLTSSADFLRRSSLWIGLTIAGLILLLILYMYRGTIKSSLFPPPAPPPTVAFSKLPKFDSNIGYKAQTGNFALQTVSGELPILPGSAKVFEIIKDKPSFGASESIKGRALNMGFTKEPAQITGSKMKFLNNSQTSQNTLTMDSLSGDLLLESDYLSNTKIVSSRPKTVEEAKAAAKSFFATAGLNLSNYPESKIETKNWRIDGGNLVESNSLSSANVVEVIYRPSDLDKLPVISAKSSESNISAIVAQNTIVFAKVKNIKIAKNRFATYPLKGVAQAYEDLKSGNAATDRNQTGNDFIVTSISLGYVQSEIENNYLMPVYLFKLDNGITTYVSAVDPRWTN